MLAALRIGVNLAIRRERPPLTSSPPAV